MLQHPHPSLGLKLHTQGPCSSKVIEITYLGLAGNVGTEKTMDNSIMGYIGTTIWLPLS